MPRARRFRDDDYEDDEDEPMPRRPRGNGQTPKVLAILGGVFVAIVAICCGAGLYVYTLTMKAANEVQQNQREDLERARDKRARDEANAANADKGRATAAVNAFLAEVRGGRLDEAYALTSAGFRKRVSEPEFARLVEANAGTFRGGFPTVEPSLFDPDEGATFSFEKRVGLSVVRLTAIRVGNVWVIDRVDQP